VEKSTTTPSKPAFWLKKTDDSSKLMRLIATSPSRTLKQKFLSNPTPMPPQ
jgi:hypothetical protein